MYIIILQNRYTRFIESNITYFNYNIVIIQTVLNDKVKQCIKKIKKINKNIKIGLLLFMKQKIYLNHGYHLIIM